MNKRVGLESGESATSRDRFGALPRGVEQSLELPVGLVYATWSAVGIVSLALIGVAVFDEPIDLAGLLGFVLVIAGVILLNVYSSAYSPT